MDSHELKELLDAVRDGRVAPAPRPSEFSSGRTRTPANSPRSTCTGGFVAAFRKSFSARGKRPPRSKRS